MKKTNAHKNNNTPAKKVTAKVAKPSISKWWFIPLAFVVAIIPLITVIHQYDTDLVKYPWYGSTQTIFDTFLYYKSFILRIVAVVILVVMGCIAAKADQSFLKEKRSLPPMIAMAVFGVMALVSAIMSEHADDAFWGGTEQFEGALVLLSYVVCFFMAFGYVRTVELVRFFLDAILIGAFVMGVLGTLQAFGLNWINSSLGKAILGLEVVGKTGLSVDDLQLSSMETSFATLYNPNYVGSYVPLMLPYCVYLVFRGMKKWRRTMAGITAVMMLIMSWSARSSAGIVALAASVFACVVLLFPFLKKKLKIVVAAAGGVVLVGAAVFMLYIGDFANIFAAEAEPHIIEDMKNEDNSVLINTSGGRNIRVSLDEEVMKYDIWSAERKISDIITVTDEDKSEALNLSLDDDTHATISQDGYPALSFAIERWTISPEQSADGFEHSFDVFHIKDGDHDWPILNAGENDALKYYNPGYGKVDDFHRVEVSGFEGRETFASGRGYIWGRTIPLLGNCLVTGYGADNFIYVFPNNDYVGDGYFTPGGHQVTTRPHNMYLQIWVQDGLPAMLAFIFLYVLFIVRVIRLCYGKRVVQPSIDEVSDANGEKKSNGKNSKKADFDDTKGIYTLRDFAIVTAIATTGYMVSGLANDSIVCVAPVFWVVLGIGYAAEAKWVNWKKLNA